MVERIILGVAAILVAVLLIYALASRQAVDNGGGDSAVVDNEAIDTGINVASYPAAPLDNEWFQENVVEQPGAVLVDFKAEWCGPCKMLHPHLVDFEEKYHDHVKLVQIDVDEQSDLAQHYQVRAMPTVLLFIDGTVVSGFLGYREPPVIEAILKPSIEEVTVSSTVIPHQQRASELVVFSDSIR